MLIKYYAKTNRRSSPYCKVGGNISSFTVSLVFHYVANEAYSKPFLNPRDNMSVVDRAMADKLSNNEFIRIF